MAYLEVDDTDFQQILEEEFHKGQIVILKFYTQMCDACMALDMELEDVDDENENVSVLAVDCSECEYTASRFSVVQVPTMVIMKDATTTLLHKEGVMLSQDIEEILNQG